MVKVARKHKRIVQTGSQQRSASAASSAWPASWFAPARIGKVQTVGLAFPASTSRGGRAGHRPPPELDYDFWLGPAPKNPYNVNHVHYNFRFFWDYAGGQMTNFGAHHLDIAQWGLGMDDSGPVDDRGQGPLQQGQLVRGDRSRARSPTSMPTA